MSQSLINPAEWAENYRVLPRTGSWSWENYAYLKPIHESKSSRIVIEKGAQLGFTESALNLALWHLDIKRLDTMYVFPTGDDSSDFSASRFALALQLCPKVRKMFTDVSNVGHKRAGGVNFYCRGGNSRSKLKSVPVGALFLDEFDEINPQSVPLARERLSGHSIEEIFEMDLSTPTILGEGIDKEIRLSTFGRWFIQCKGCGTRQYMTFEGNLTWDETKGTIEDKVLSASYKCSKCSKLWCDREKNNLVRYGEYVEEHPGRLVDGFHVPQMYGHTMGAARIVHAYLESEGDEFKTTEFFNSKLGLGYIADGAKVTSDDVLSCATVNRKRSSTGATVGIDVSPDNMHYIEVAEWHDGQKVVLDMIRTSWEGLDQIMKQYNVVLAIIDSQPEVTKSTEFVEQWDGYAYRAYFPEGMKKTYSIREDAGIINIHRTQAIDKALRRFRRGTISIPKDSDNLFAYSRHIQAPVRIYKTDRNNRKVIRYTEGNESDHFAMASAYNEIAGILVGDTHLLEVTDVDDQVGDIFAGSNGEFFLEEV